MKKFWLDVFVFFLVLLAGCVGEKGAVNMAEEGRKIAEAKGCFTCHSVDGTIKKAPSWLGLYASEVELEDGSKVVVDDTYLRESILEPQAKIVKDYEDKAPMPNFKDRMTEDELNKIMAYIKTLK